jgi:hypothetical protein
MVKANCMNRPDAPSVPTRVRTTLFATRVAIEIARRVPSPTLREKLRTGRPHSLGIGVLYRIGAYVAVVLRRKRIQLHHSLEFPCPSDHRNVYGVGSENIQFS